MNWDEEHGSGFLPQVLPPLSIAPLAVPNGYGRRLVQEIVQATLVQMIQTGALALGEQLVAPPVQGSIGVLFYAFKYPGLLASINKAKERKL